MANPNRERALITLKKLIAEAERLGIPAKFIRQLRKAAELGAKHQLNDDCQPRVLLPVGTLMLERTAVDAVLWAATNGRVVLNALSNPKRVARAVVMRVLPDMTEERIREIIAGIQERGNPMRQLFEDVMLVRRRPGVG